jgi:hypothetical protein
MRRSITSAATDRRRLAAVLIAELVCALLLVGTAEPAPEGPAVATQASHTTAAAPSASQTLHDGRSVRLIGLGTATRPLLTRISSELHGASDAVTAFWGPDWPRDIVIVAAGTDEQFAAVGGGDSHTAATTTGDRIMFAPGAAAMSEGSLRIVLRHELFHFAARAKTAVDAPRWLTEGVADFVARPRTPVDVMPTPPTDAELDGPARSQAYDRAWMFSQFVADRYGTDKLRQLYTRACGPGHPDAPTAVRETLGIELPLA